MKANARMDPVFRKRAGAWLSIVGISGLASIGQADVDLHQAADRSVAVRTGVYTAKIAANGDLTELSVKDAKAFTHPFGDPGKPPAVVPSINVNGKMVAVRSGQARTEWTFGEDRIDVLTEGYNYECRLDPSVKIVLESGGKSRPYDNAPGGTAGGGVIGLVLDNGLTALASAGGKPFLLHVHSPRILPNHYTGGFGKPGDPLTWTWLLGGKPGAAQLITGLDVVGVGADEAVLQAGGNRGQGIVHFPAAVPVAFQLGQRNQSETETVKLEYRVEVWDHYLWRMSHFGGVPAATEIVQRHRLHFSTHLAELAPGQTAQVTTERLHLKPGFYYLFVAAWQGDQKLTEIDGIPFTVDLPAYQPITTRPADFDAFWARQEEKLRQTPLKPQVVRVSPAGAAGDLYEVTGDMPGAKPFRALYEVPAGDGPHRYVLLSSQLDHLLDQKKLEAAKPGWKSDAAMPVLWVSAAEAATYGRWASAEDNNLLENILIWLRAVDYLKSRPDVLPGSIRLFGASRGGPLVLVTAARRPADIAGAAAHVHTSCGLSWTHKPYYGWGLPGGHNSRDPAAVEALAAMAAYVDPVNHAQDIRCPITFAYGISDWGLSPPEGIEAAYQLCGSAWKRISRDAGGHVFTAGTRDIMKQLDEHLLSAHGAVDQSHIMKEH